VTAKKDDDQPAGEEDELRRKYREALARKKQNDSAPEGHRAETKGPGGGSGGAHTQRMFRRKSGG